MKKVKATTRNPNLNFVKFFDMNQRQQFDDLSLGVMHSYARKTHRHIPKGTKFSTRLMSEDGAGYLLLSIDDEMVDTVGLIASPDLFIPDQPMFEVLNEMAEKIFREESRYGLKDPGKLDAIIHACRAELFGHVQYPGVVEKAAAFWFKLADSQCFHNGNKRTALLTALFVLSLNGFELANVDGNELYDISLKIANKSMSQSEVARFIRLNLLAKVYTSRADAETLESSFEIKMKIDKQDE